MDDEDQVGDLGGDSDEEIPEGAGRSDNDKVPDAEKRLVEKLHVNMGHPSKQRFLRVLRAAGAKLGVLKWIKAECRCSACAERSRVSPHRKVAIPRTFRFNQILAVDTVNLPVPFLQTTVPFLNMVDHGSNLQVMTLLRGRSARDAWEAIAKSWLRPFGAPYVILCDGGPEFQDEFSDGAERIGALLHVVGAQSPWQNGKCERHGGWAEYV